MANIEINQLPVATTPLSGTELIPADQGATTVQVTTADIVALANVTNVTNGLATPQIIANTLSNRPISSLIGTIFVATDPPYYVSRYNGSNWVDIAGAVQSISSSTLNIDNTAPAVPIIDLSYKSYVAVISQSGTSAPTVDYILENTLGGAISFGYSAAGNYLVTNSGSLFTDQKTIVFINPGYMPSGFVNTAVSVGWERNSSSQITIKSKNASTGTDTDSLIYLATIEIRVYL